MTVGLTGVCLKIDSFDKKDGTKVPYIDLYLPEDGSSVRVNGYEGDSHAFGSDVQLVVKVYNGQNDLYIKYVSEV